MSPKNLIFASILSKGIINLTFYEKNKMKVVFLLTAHAADDDRVWYHQVPSLLQHNCEVAVIAPRVAQLSSPLMRIYNPEILSRQQLIRHLAELLLEQHPDVVIGDTPMALCGALTYRRKNHTACRILYDVTEWYPSKKNVRNLGLVRRLLKRTILCAFNVYVNCLADGFVFGEKYKSLPFRRLFPHKPYVYVSYYPDLKYIPSSQHSALNDEVRLFYSGPLTEEKGFPHVLASAAMVARRHPDWKVNLKVLTADHPCVHAELPGNLSLDIQPYQLFEPFCQTLAEQDLFLDLRSTDRENRKCLPIKLFYYMAVGRPVIYSNLDAIEDGCPEIGQFGHLVDPKDECSVADTIERYVLHPDEYQQHCDAARRLAEQKYYWKAIEADFVRFILQHE